MASSWTAMGKAPEEKIGLQDEQQEIRFTSFPKAFGFALKAPPIEPQKDESWYSDPETKAGTTEPSSKRQVEMVVGW